MSTWTHATRLALMIDLAESAGVKFSSLTLAERRVWADRADVEHLADLRREMRLARVSLEFAPSSLPDFLHAARRAAYDTARERYTAALTSAPMSALAEWHEQRMADLSA